MKKLTSNEVEFIKKTGFTPTVYQCDEWNRTNKAPYYIDSFAEAQNIAREDFDIDLIKLLDKIINIDNCDGISLEYEATYLFYTFFTKDELLDMDTSWALKWLQDFKYYHGYRKWDEQFVECEIQEALEVYGGSREFYEWPNDGEVWNRCIGD